MDHPVRHDWSEAEALALFALPFADLLYRAQSAHRANFDPNRVQIATLLSIKTGGASKSVPIKFTFPANLPAGTYVLVATITPLTGETSQSNNTAISDTFAIA